MTPPPSCRNIRTYVLKHRSRHWLYGARGLANRTAILNRPPRRYHRDAKRPQGRTYRSASGGRLIGKPTRCAGTPHRAFQEDRELWYPLHILALETSASGGPAGATIMPGLFVRLRRLGEPARRRGAKSPANQIRVLRDLPSQSIETTSGIDTAEAALQKASIRLRRTRFAGTSSDVAARGRRGRARNSSRSQSGRPRPRPDAD